MSDKPNQKHNLFGALRIVWRLVGRYLGVRRGWLTMLLVLSVMLIAAQAGLIVTILEIVDRIVSSSVPNGSTSLPHEASGNVGFVDQILASASALLEPLDTMAVLGVCFVIYLTLALTQYATSLLTVHINLSVFKSTMTDLASALLHQHKQRRYTLTGGETSGLFTRGARYSGIICGRTAGSFPALLSLPFLLAFAFLLAPKLFGMMALGFLLLLPLQYFVMREGLNATQGLLSSAAKHGQGKKQFHDVLSFAQSDDLPTLEEVEQHYIGDPSRGFLGFYKRRRLLGARAFLLSALSIGLVGGVVLVSLLLPNSGMAVPLGGVVVFLITLQFIASAFSKIAVFATTTSSLAPLMGPIDGVLFGEKTKDQVGFTSVDVSKLDAVLASRTVDSPTPQAFIFGAEMAFPHLAINRLSGPDGNAGLVSSRMPSIHRDIARNLGLDQKQALDHFKLLVPTGIVEAFDQAIEVESLEGFSQDLWDSLPPALIVWATASTAIAKKQRIVFFGPIGGTIGQSAFDGLCQAIAGADLECLQVMASPPKRLKNIKGSAVFHLARNELVHLIRAEDDQDQVPAITAALTKLQTQSKERTSDFIDEEEDLLES